MKTENLFHFVYYERSILKINWYGSGLRVKIENERLKLVRVRRRQNFKFGDFTSLLRVQQKRAKMRAARLFSSYNQLYCFVAFLLTTAS